MLPLIMTGCITRATSVTVGGTPFAVELWASAQCVSAGDTLSVRATVTNRDSRAQRVEMTSQPVLDLFIGYRTQAGSINMAWSDGKLLNEQLMRLELAPGESKSIEMKLVVPNPAPSSIGISARFFDDARFTDHPLSPFMAIYGPSACPGPFGP